MAKLHFYYSAMNAGKTTTLLQSSYNYHERGMSTLLYTPAIDGRFSKGKIASRIGLTSDAIPFDENFNIFEHVRKMLTVMANLKCILVDEAQFMTKAQVEQLTDVVDKFNLPVLAYGLRTDFTGEPFEASKYLLAWAQELTEIKTICHCGSKATMNARIDEKGQIIRTGAQIEIGGNERYIALCHKHYKEGQTRSIFTQKIT